MAFHEGETHSWLEFWDDSRWVELDPTNDRFTDENDIILAQGRDIQGADLCIDVHSSNIYLRELPQIRISMPTVMTLLPYGKLLNVDFI
ncbi:MAG: hypothetical protein LUC50_06185 [Ruminococcus sp.]|nr:hypothetical protein [Ruminococcus sp.]